MEDSELEKINNKLSMLIEKIQDEEIWEISTLIGKLGDVKYFIECLDLEELFSKKRLPLLDGSRLIYEFIIKNNISSPFDRILSKRLSNYFASQLMLMVEAAINDTDEAEIIKICSFAFDIRNFGDEDFIYKDLSLFAENNLDFNYIDEIVEASVFMIAQNYQLTDEEIRDDDGGLSPEKIAVALSASF